MRVLYICRLFTGLERSLHQRRWEPTGAPTIYRMMEALDRSAGDVCFMLARKDMGRGSFSTWTEKQDYRLNIEGLRHPVTVLAGEERYPRLLGHKLRSLLRELRHLWKIARAVCYFKPDLIYVDHANFLSAAVFSRLLRIPVVYRLMGVYPAMRVALSGRRLSQRVLRWAYRSPFALVVCTQDGSGVEPWLDQALHPDVSRTVLLNGVSRNMPSGNIDPRLSSLPSNRLRVLFVGKLETYKGCDDFVEALLRLRQTHAGRVHAIVIGVGNRREALVQQVRVAGATEDFTFIDRLPHGQMLAAYHCADIYVSLNTLGNLSNANLEAMVSGICMVFPEADPETGIDVETDRLIGRDTAVRVPRVGRVDALARALARLCDNPDERRHLGRAMAEAAERFIPTWEQRMAHEFSLLEGLVADNGRCRN